MGASVQKLSGNRHKRKGEHKEDGDQSLTVHACGHKSRVPASETMGQTWGQTLQPVGGAHPLTAASQEGFCLFGWVTWFGKEVPFYNSARDSSQSLATQYDVLTFFKRKKAEKLSRAHLVSVRSPHVYFWLSEQCCSSPCTLEQVSVPFKEK